jgi:MscS family membrane protein
LGNLDAKLQRLDGFLTLPPDKRANGAARLSAEREVDRAVSTAVAELRDFAGAIRTREKRGLSRDERLDLLSRFEPLRRSIGWLDGPTIPEAEYQRGDEDLLDRGLPAGSLARLGWDWVRLWTQDPDLVEEEDLRRLRAYWGERILALLRRVEGIRSKLERGGGLELRLDDHVLRVVAWIRKEFKHKTPAWKESGTGFKGLVEGGYRFNMVFYVDNIELEHFERQGRVEGQIRREVFRRLTEEGVALPAPKYEVALRGSALTEAKERLSA